MADVTTVIGDSIHLRGALHGDEDLTVLGRIEGTIELSRTLIVEPSGVVKADVTVQNAIISGVVVGNISAADSVEITREGRMVGDISAPRVILVDGASFRGQIDMGNLELPRPSNSSFDRSRPTTSRRETAAPLRSQSSERRDEAIDEHEEQERPEPPRPSITRPEPLPRTSLPPRVQRSEPTAPIRTSSSSAPSSSSTSSNTPSSSSTSSSSASPAKKADAVAPRPKVMQNKKRKVSVRKR